MMQKLNNIKEKNPFKIPENYFEEVNRKIISATAGYDQDIKKPGLYNKIRPYLLVAASVTGFILLSYTAARLFSTDRSDLHISELQYEDYPELYMNEFDIATLEEKAASLFLNEEVPEVKQSEIIDYLLLENIEINDIYEQL
jgi:hypothetical protein